MSGGLLRVVRPGASHLLRVDSDVDGDEAVLLVGVHHAGHFDPGPIATLGENDVRQLRNALTEWLVGRREW